MKNTCLCLMMSPYRRVKVSSGLVSVKLALFVILMLGFHNSDSYSTQYIGGRGSKRIKVIYFLALLNDLRSKNLFSILCLVWTIDTSLR